MLSKILPVSAFTLATAAHSAVPVAFAVGEIEELSLGSEFKVDLVEMLRMSGFERELSRSLPGNSSGVALESASLTFSGQGISGHLQAQLLFKNRSCVPKPRPLKGAWCGDTYNFSTQMTALFDVAEGCQIENLDIQKSETTAGRVVGTVVHEAWERVQGRVEGLMAARLTDLFRERNELAQFCSGDPT